jgi:endonuclease/exonuclease/phosphatase family metal-dependent hydrolase
MRKLKFFDKILWLVNRMLAVIVLLSYSLPFLPPKTFAILSVLSLGVALLILVNVFFVVYWAVKLKKQFLLSLVVLVIGYLSFGSLYKFDAPTNVKASNAINVMSYNVRLFNLYNWLPAANVETHIADFITTASPDILSLQEYHPHKNVNLSLFKYKYEKLSGKTTKYGQAIFSKFPIINSGSIAFPNTSNNAIFVDLVMHKDTVRVYNIHLESLRIDPKLEALSKEGSERVFKRVGNTFKMQQSQTELFLEHKAKCPYKMIVCGDFNNTAFSYVYRKIKGSLNDAFEMAGTGFGPTYNFRFFPVRIDFILADTDFNVNNFNTYSVEHSDHYPVMATLALEN